MHKIMCAAKEAKLSRDKQGLIGVGKVRGREARKSVWVRSMRNMYSRTRASLCAMFKEKQ